MKQTFLTVAVAIGVAFGMLFAISIGVAVTLSITPWGRSLSGKTTLSARPWEDVRTGYYTLLAGVILPTVVAGGYIIGRFAPRFPLIAAGLAILPVALIASGFRLEMTWASITLLCFGTVAAHVAKVRKALTKGGP